jgi:hypothetical protein
VLSVMMQLAVEPDVLAATGETIATKLRDNIAPIAAVVVGAFGLKYLLREDKSLAGFVGFLMLGAFVYALIRWGGPILNSLGGLVSSLFT